MRILLVADVHGNYSALTAVLADAGDVDAIWNLGDTVGYGPYPNECVELLRARGATPFLAGNHDLAALDERYLAGFNPVAAAAARWTAQTLAKETRAFLASLEPAATIGDIALAHGSPRQPVWEYILSEDAADANLRLMTSQICFVGHTHVPMLATRSERGGTSIAVPQDRDEIDLTRGPIIFNPGSVGQPRDGDPRASYAIFESDQRRVTLHRADYDIGATQRAIIAAGLPERLASRLTVGR